ncbi:Type 1 glutamine amidotransferase-like domain-containing protein [Leucobacter massiliensis]|uniref:Type 1 glutamine amidotransferase-like domain-containing protein n=1 Tax=Leucobacter massiliensis TaxID=1686285 RepID=UPI0015E2ABE5|nr:Type 1 glutamine amidotransferase-like domain-containing protein [Leucobacter massiliensis]
MSVDGDAERRLLLTSFFARVARLLPAFAEAKLAGRRVCFIPTATIPERFTLHLRAERRALRRLGLELDELELSAATPAETAEAMGAADILFVSGGNTFFLAQELRRTGADRLIAAHIAAGRIYIGASAGSMVLAPRLDYVAHMDSPSAAPALRGDFAGLGITEFGVVPHAGNVPFRRATRRIVETYGERMVLLPISNREAVAVTGARVRMLRA